MSWRIIIEKPAMKFLQKQPKAQRDRLLKAMYALPDTGDIKPLHGRDCLFRLRVGDYRVLYNLESGILTVYVLDAGTRGEIYK